MPRKPIGDRPMTGAERQYPSAEHRGAGISMRLDVVGEASVSTAD
jgi:hypothetical protein